MTCGPSDASVCTDLTVPWADNGGDNCATYTTNSRCSAHGSGYENHGLVANQACCSCGGGNQPSSPSCTDLTVPWHDNGGGSCAAYTAEMVLVKQALMSLYNSTNGHTWAWNSGWGGSESHCQWYGVACSSSATVKKLYVASSRGALSVGCPGC